MIYFNQNAHVYYNTEGIIYDSPSKVFSRYKNKFDAAVAAKRYAEKHGMDADYWIAQWDKTRNNSLERGTGIHQTKEDLMMGRGIDKHLGRIYTVFNPDLYVGGNLITELKDLPDGVYPEIPLWNHHYHISGKPDKLVIETVLGHRYAHIDDYKTNKSIDKVSYQDWRYPEAGGWKMMKRPLGHLMDCNWVHYMLQMSFYQFIMDQAGFKAGKMTLIHIPHPITESAGDNTWVTQPTDVLYDIPYAKPEIVLTLNHYNRGRVLEYYTPQNDDNK